jgi:hypothetical protein
MCVHISDIELDDFSTAGDIFDKEMKVTYVIFQMFHMNITVRLYTTIS